MLSAIAGYDPRDPLSLAAPTDFTGAVRQLDRRACASPTRRDYDVFPVDRRVAAVVDEAVRAFEDAGAHVEPVRLGIQRDQRELSDLWCRLIMPINVAGMEASRRPASTSCATHPDDLPPQYRTWLERGYGLSALDIANDQAMRTEVFDAFQGVLGRLRPRRRADAVQSAGRERRRTAPSPSGPSEVEGVAVDELIGWCPTYLSTSPAIRPPRSQLGMADGLPVGMQIIGRQFRRRRPARGQRGVRAAAAVGRQLPHSGAADPVSSTLGPPARTYRLFADLVGRTSQVG